MFSNRAAKSTPTIESTTTKRFGGVYLASQALTYKFTFYKKNKKFGVICFCRMRVCSLTT